MILENLFQRMVKICSTQYPSRPEWSPDGKKIAYIHGGDHSMLWYALKKYLLSMWKQAI